MHTGIFQLLPQGSHCDCEIIEQALWEVDFAERHGFDSVWVTEHHFTALGTISAPSVYAAAIAQRTERIRIGYGVAVVPLHHPLRLAEEIAWVDHLSRGRVMVGLGPGFSAEEFAVFGVPLEERHARLKEGVEIVRRALRDPELGLRPRPYTKPHPPFFRASSSEESLREAAAEGTPLLFGLKTDLRQRLDLYRSIREQTADEEIAQMYVLRRICIAPTDDEALAQLREALDEEDLDGTFCGSPDTIARQLEELHALGIRNVIGWFHFGNMPYAKVRRSMELYHDLRK